MAKRHETSRCEINEESNREQALPWETALRRPVRRLRPPLGALGPESVRGAGEQPPPTNR